MAKRAGQNSGIRLWHRAALNHAGAVRRSPTLPVWLVLVVTLIDYVLVGIWFRCTGKFSVGDWALWDAILYLTRLANVTVIIIVGCGQYRVSAWSLGIRSTNVTSDLRWSTRCCLIGASIIGVATVVCFCAACLLGIHLPAPPGLVVQLLGSRHWSASHFILLGSMGGTTVLLAPFTEELIYRSLLLPAMAARFGLYPAVALTAILFGLVHVIPYGETGIPGPQILGGLMMAAAFSIRWSVVPAMVLHGMGNLFIGVLCFLYVRLYEAYPTLFLTR